MKASELLVRCLENERIDAIFGIPGEENIDVMDALLESDLRFILTRHEHLASEMKVRSESGAVEASGRAALRA